MQVFIENIFSNHEQNLIYSSYKFIDSVTKLGARGGAVG